MTNVFNEQDVQRFNELSHDICYVVLDMISEDEEFVNLAQVAMAVAAMRDATKCLDKIVKGEMGIEVFQYIPTSEDTMH